MQRTRVKVCGMRDPLQVKQLVDLGVDAIGMIFFQDSSRNVSIEQAQRIREVVPAFVSLVGVFVDFSVEQINAIAEQVQLDIVQLHGDQDVDFAKKIQRPYIKVVRVLDKESVAVALTEHQEAVAILLDTFSKLEFGGTGHRIPKEFLSNPLPENIILAGGISLENINEVLEFRPYALDINSGVEYSPANKNISKLIKIMKKIHKFDQECR